LIAALAVASAAAPAAAQRSRGQHGRDKHAAPVDSSGVPQAETKTGCAVFEVRISVSNAVTVGRIGSPSCGPIEPVLVAQPELDAARHVLTMSIALVDHGVDRLHPPAAVEAGPSALVVTGGAPPPVKDTSPPPPAAPQSPPPDSTPPSPSPPAQSGSPGTVVLVGGATPLSMRTGTSAPGHPAAAAAAVHFVGADPPPADTVPGEEVAAQWSFDKLLAEPGHDPVVADDGSMVLPAGDTSQARQISVVVPPGVTAFRVSLQGTGQYVFTVPLRAPDTVSRDEVEDSRAPENILTNAPGFPGQVVRDKLWVMFRQDANPEQRQAAIDAVSGVVIGGMLRGQDRYYYVRISANPDSGAAPLVRALRTLALMPQVQDVIPDRGQN
jgi:hypothetical protein